MLANTIAAARDAGATILFPANVYVFSAASPATVDETTPRRPTTRKGKVRLEMETMLARASEEHGVRVIAVRAGDFFGPGTVSSWFSQALAQRRAGGEVRRDAGQARRRACLGLHTGRRRDIRTARRPAVRARPLHPRAFRRALRRLGTGPRGGRAPRDRAHGPADPAVPLDRPSGSAPPSCASCAKPSKCAGCGRPASRSTTAGCAAWIGEEPHTPLDDAVRNALAG